ncbi:MAG: DUF3291 domain-containing protein [Alteromonadaceae bacterium]|nr:DUF3291 domain-containing protein [Alteromonadaceae bacterium]
MSQDYYLAQLNIAKTLAPLESPKLKEFVDNLDRINGIAESSPGFVWRLKDDTGNATEISAFDDPNIIVNMSVWQDIQSLKQFMFKTDHASFLMRREQWFEKPTQPTYVLWWVPKSHTPTLDEAKQKLAHLREHGDTEHAFSMRKVYAAP